MEENKGKLQERRPVAFATGVLILGTAVLVLCSIIMGLLYANVPFFEENTIYLVQLFVDFAGFLCFIYIMKRLGYLHYFNECNIGLFRGLIVGGYFLVISIIAIFSYSGYFIEYEFQPVMDIIIFILCMFAIGLAEETLFRGVISNILLEAFGKSAYGVRFSVLVSGILFGLFHLSNAIGGSIELTGVITQVILASAIGMSFTAIYYRTGNLWVVITLHALNDFAGLFLSGIFATNSITDTISGYSLENFLALVPQFIVVLFLLRPKGMEKILGHTTMEQMLGLTENEEERKLKRRFYITLVGYILAIAITAVAIA